MEVMLGPLVSIPRGKGVPSRSGDPASRVSLRTGEVFARGRMSPAGPLADGCSVARRSFARCTAGVRT